MLTLYKFHHTKNNYPKTQGTTWVDAQGPLDLKSQVNSKMILGTVFEELVASSKRFSSQGCKGNLMLSTRQPQGIR